MIRDLCSVNKLPSRFTSFKEKIAQKQAYIRFVISRIGECVSRIAYRAMLADESGAVRTAIYQSI